MDTTNGTHDPALTSWVEAANAPNTDFPIQNLPFGVFRRKYSTESPRGGIAIGDQVLDLQACVRNQLLEGVVAEAAIQPTLNAFLALGSEAWSELRRQLSELLREGSPVAALAHRVLVPQIEAEMLLPVDIGDYTDAYASIFHATNIGSMFRPDNPLLPNYKYVPIAYHGRASSIMTSGAHVRRPNGQTRPDAEALPQYGPCAALDYELEVGFFVGPGNALGTPLPIEQAEQHIFGLCLVNDWSARDIQRWEYQPLGPFLAKSFATTISPWIVTLEAVAPFRAPAFARPDGDPQPLPYLFSADDQARGGIDLTLEVFLRTEQMRAENSAPFRLSRGSFTDMYWTIAQLLTHHASNGCNLRAGDLIASGTVSGPTPEARGCLQELTQGGTEPIALPNGEKRRFLADGDEVILRGYCERVGFRRIGFGECVGRVASSQ